MPYYRGNQSGRLEIAPMPACLPFPLSRRGLFRAAGLGAAAAAVAPAAASAQGAVPKALDWLGQAVGGRKPVAGRIELKLPDIADNGNTVPITVTVDHPMTAERYVKAIHVAADANPRPEVLSVRFTPLSPKAEVSTRMRLARTQNVIAYAELSDGTVWSARAEVKVTIGGCGA